MTKLIADEIPFRRIDPRYRTVEMIVHAIVLVMCTGAAVAAALLIRSVVPAYVAWGIVIVVFALCVWAWRLSLRRIKVLGYFEASDELLVRKGIMFQHLTVVPYGRMQQIHVSSGPLMRHYGLAKVQLVTASSDTDARIPGISAEEAERLRKKLTDLGNAKLEGL